MARLSWLSWLVLTCCVRCMYMDHMYDRLCKKGVVTDVGGDGLFDVHKVALRLTQVEAAAAQGNCSLALRLLKTTHEVAYCAVVYV